MNLAALTELAVALTDIPSAERYPVVYDSRIPDVFTKEDVKDWASLEANISEAYARGSIPGLRDFVGQAQHTKLIGLDLINLEVAKLDETFHASFPETLREYAAERGFRDWFVKKLDDPGFYHFCVQFGASSDPEFISFLWAIWKQDSPRIMECLRDRAISPEGIRLPAGFRDEIKPHTRSAWGHFCTYEGFALCERAYELKVYHLRARHARSAAPTVISHSGPMTLNESCLETIMIYAAEMLASSGELAFYVPVLNESLRRLNATLSWPLADADLVPTVEETKSRVAIAVDNANHMSSIADVSTLTLAKAEPITLGAWGDSGVFFVVEKRPIRASIAFPCVRSLRAYQPATV